MKNLFLLRNSLWRQKVNVTRRSRHTCFPGPAALLPAAALVAPTAGWGCVCGGSKEPESMQGSPGVFHLFQGRACVLLKGHLTFHCFPQEGVNMACGNGDGWESRSARRKWLLDCHPSVRTAPLQYLCEGSFPHFFVVVGLRRNPQMASPYLPTTCFHAFLSGTPGFFPGVCNVLGYRPSIPTPTPLWWGIVEPPISFLSVLWIFPWNHGP